MHSEYDLRKQKENDGMISDLRAALQGTLICGLLMMGCGLVGDTTRPRDVERTSEVVFQTVADGLAGYVSIDSLEWVPFLPLPLSNGTFEIAGGFAAVFRNSGPDSVGVRYDLRFFDDEETLVDAFIPFGQPVVLASGQRRVVQGEFILRTGDLYQTEHLAHMQLVARVRNPEE